jgi:hypothetical protein
MMLGKDEQPHKRGIEICPDCGLPKTVCCCDEINHPDKIWKSRYERLVEALEKVLVLVPF